VQDRLGLVLEISAYNYTPNYAGEFGVAATAEEGKLAAARAAVQRVLEEAKTVAPTREELARAKRKVQAQKVFSEMTAAGLAGALGSDWVTAGDLDFSETYVAGIEQVTSEQVLRAARAYLDPRKQNFAVLLPEGKGAETAGPVPTAPAEGASDVSWLSPDIPAQVTRARLFLGLPLWELKLANGVRVLLRRDPELPAVHLCLAGLGGQRWEPAELAGAASVLAEMLPRGTRSRTQAEIAAQVENLGAHLTGFSGRHSFGVQVRGLKGDLRVLLELGADCLLRPAFPAGQLEKTRQETLAAIAEQDESLFVLDRKIKQGPDDLAVAPLTPSGIGLRDIAGLRAGTGDASLTEEGRGN
jgi:zinc protease